MRLTSLTRSMTLKAVIVSGCRLAYPSKLRVREAPVEQARMMLTRFSRKCGDMLGWASIASAFDWMPMMRLLKSWATPLASSPIVSSFFWLTAPCAFSSQLTESWKQNRYQWSSSSGLAPGTLW
jgi:hypothetical protein